MRQQIILSGLGGQGVLFATRIIAATALDMNLHVLSSETHGMAQRGGNVVCHLKVFGGNGEGVFTSPMIRPGMADVLLAFHPEGAKLHGHFLKKSGVLICNDTKMIDATGIALKLGNGLLTNIVLLGYAVARKCLFCGADSLRKALQNASGPRAEENLRAFEAGFMEATS